MTTKIRLLLVEDSDDDVFIVTRALEKDGFDISTTVVQTRDALRAALESGGWDLVISDYRLPGFTGLDSLEIFKKTGFDVPFILVSGTVSDELAVSAMKAGAHDYVMKGNLTRLGPAIRRELEEVEVRRARRRAEEGYRNLVEHSLQGLAIIENGRLDYVNRALSEILGLSREQLSALTAEQVVALAHPDDRALLAERFLDPADHDTSDQRDELRLLRSTGEVRWVAMFSSRNIVEGQPATQVAFVDITARKHQERELRAIANLASTLRATTSREEMVPLLLHQVGRLLEADGTALAIPDEHCEQVAIEHSWGTWSERATRTASANHPASAEVVATGVAFVGAPSDASDPLSDADLMASSRSLIGLPLIAEERVIGVLWVGRTIPIEEEDIRILTAIGDMAASALHRATLHEETRLRLQRLHALRSVDLAITTSRDLDVVFDVVLEQVVSQLEVHGAVVHRVTKGSGTLCQVAEHGLENRSSTPTEISIGDGLAGRAAQGTRLLEISNLAEAEGLSSRDKQLVEAGFVSYLGVPLMASGILCGVLELIHRQPLEMDEEWKGFLETVAWQAATAIDGAALLEELRQSNTELTEAYESTLEGWARALELRDQETEGHTRRVTELTARLAGVFGLNGDELTNARRGAMLHDIGKMAIPDSILLKPGPLDDREWEIMRRHPLHAVEMLSSISHLKPALVIPYGHHERWDGSGYPLGLAGEDIPLLARIFAVVDVWDALRSNRPYRKAWSAEEVAAYLRKEADKTLDAKVVEEFLGMVE